MLYREYCISPESIRIRSTYTIFMLLVVQVYVYLYLLYPSRMDMITSYGN